MTPTQLKALLDARGSAADLWNLLDAAAERKDAKP